MALRHLFGTSARSWTIAGGELGPPRLCSAGFAHLPVMNLHDPASPSEPRIDDRVCAATIELACSAISYQHRHAGAPDPIATETVCLARRGLRRRLGTAARRPARALTTEEIRQIVTPSTDPPPRAPATPP